MIFKVLNAVLIVFTVFMGLKQGLAMMGQKPEMIAMFSRWHFSKPAVIINGVVTVLSALMILFPKTFVLGNFLMAATILMIICFSLYSRDLKGAAIEVPFFLLNLLIIYLHHPLAK